MYRSLSAVDHTEKTEAEKKSWQEKLCKHSVDYGFSSRPHFVVVMLHWQQQLIILGICVPYSNDVPVVISVNKLNAKRLASTALLVMICLTRHHMHVPFVYCMKLHIAVYMSLPYSSSVLAD